MTYNNSTQTELGEKTRRSTWGTKSEDTCKTTPVTTNDSVTTVTAPQRAQKENKNTELYTPSETWGDEIKEFTTIVSAFKNEHLIKIITEEKQNTLIEVWNEETKPNSSIKTKLKSLKQKSKPDVSQRNKKEIKPISNHAKKHSNSNTQNNTHNSTNEREKLDKDNKPKRSVDNKLINKNCPECGSEIVKQNTEQYCSDCGVLLCQENIDPGPEWRAFNHTEQQSKSRVGEPINNKIHDKGLSTVIGEDNKDAKGSKLSNKKQYRMKRLRKWDKRFKVKDTQERNMRQAFGEIQRLASEMELPDYVEETACTIYRKALDEELLPGRSIESMTSASVYIAMRQASIPKTLDSLLQYCRVDDSRITGAYSYISEELGIEIEPPQVSEHLSRIASELSVSKETERKAKDILDMSVDENIHSGKDPSGMAASAVYAATMITRKDRVTQKDACNAGDVCELTIRNRNRELLNMYGLNYDEISPPSKDEVAD